MVIVLISQENHILSFDENQIVQLSIKMVDT